MEGKIQVNSGDVSIIAVKVDGTVVDTIPEKGQGKYFESAECDKGALGTWDGINWEFRIQKLTQTKTKCTLNFVSNPPSGEQSGENKLEFLVQQQETNDTLGTIVRDDYNNIRYIGKSPNNWVTFNEEQWRIIGLMDGINTSTGKTERLLKIIRSDYLGTYSWDSSSLSVNYGKGVNEWSEADIQKVLNNNYLKRTSGGTCYDGYENSQKNCPNWTTVGLDATAQNMIEEVVWNIGTADTTYWTSSNVTPLQYQWERSTNHGKQCSGEYYCTDTVERKTTWTGKVGLMYPSDYGYATDGGGDLMKRGQCLYTPLSSWDNSSYCYLNDWLSYYSISQWTMTPAPASSYATKVFFVVDTRGFIGNDNACDAYAVRPVVYLKSSVKIISGTGEESSPYQLKLG